MFAGLHVQHELRQRAVQPRYRAAQESEARTGKQGTGVELHPQRRAEIDVVLDGKGVGTRASPAGHFDVVGFGLADRDAFLRQIGNHRDEGVELREQFGECNFVGVEFAFERRDLAHHGAGVFAPALHHADLL